MSAGTRVVFVHHDDRRECRPGVFNAGSARRPDYLGAFFYVEPGDPPGSRRYCGRDHGRDKGSVVEEPGEVCQRCGWPVELDPNLGTWIGAGGGTNRCPTDHRGHSVAGAASGLADG